MKPEERDALMMDALLGDQSTSSRAQLNDLLATDETARAEWEEFQSIWRDLDGVLSSPASAGNSGLSAVVESLARRRARPSRWWVSGALAAGVVMFVVGAWVSPMRRADDARVQVDAAVRQPRFAVLLYASSSDTRPDPALLQQVIDEQKAWAGRLRLEKRHVVSEKLSTQPGVELETVRDVVEQRRGETASGGLRLGGFYIIQAQDLDEATEIARQCPLLRYGGVVRVRVIEDV